MKINVKSIELASDEILVINGMLSIDITEGSSALPVIEGEALGISGQIDSVPQGYAPGNSGYFQREYRRDKLYVQPGIAIPHESQLPKSFLVAEGGMYWRSDPIPISHSTCQDEENSMYWRKHGEIVYNKDVGEITFPELTDEVVRLWKGVSFPLLQKQLKEMEEDR